MAEILKIIDFWITNSLKKWLSQKSCLDKRSSMISKMWFTERLSLKLCIPAAVFYSTILASKCRVLADASGHPPGDSDESIHIFRTEVPWEPIELDTEKNTFAIMAWTAVLSVAVSVAAIICLCCLCWKLYPKYSSRRQSSNAVLVPRQHANVVGYPTDHMDGQMVRSTRRGNSYSTRITSFAFVGSLRDPTPGTHGKDEDGPPAYSIVISQTPPSDKLTSSTSFPRDSEMKTVETPPPAYITVAPFQ